jgi:methanogen extracellular protein (TIGR04279 family)
MLALLILSLSSISPLINHLILTGEPAAAIAWANPAVTVQMTFPGLVENVWFADHVNDLATGNWIELSGGTAVTLPYLRFDYSGVSDYTFTKAGKNVHIHSSFTTKSVVYPIATHPVYMPLDSITANFRGESSLSGVSASYKLVQGSATDWEQAYTDLLTNADLTKLKAIISAAVVTVPITFGVDGDVSTTFSAPATPGGYILVAVYEATGAGTYDLFIFGATPVEVLDHAMTTTAPASVTAGDSFGVTFAMTAPVSPNYYRYGAVIISQAAYSLVANLQTTGALSATDLFLNSVDGADLRRREHRDSLLQPDQHLPRLPPVGAGADAEVRHGIWERELVEEIAGHGVVVVLPRVHDQHLHLRKIPRSMHDRRRFNDLGPSPYHESDTHGITDP